MLARRLCRGRPSAQELAAADSTGNAGPSNGSTKRTAVQQFQTATHLRDRQLARRMESDAFHQAKALQARRFFGSIGNKVRHKAGQEARSCDRSQLPAHSSGVKPLLLSLRVVPPTRHLKNRGKHRSRNRSRNAAIDTDCQQEKPPSHSLHPAEWKPGWSHWVPIRSRLGRMPGESARP